MNEERAKRKLSAILSADVKGYSRLMGEDELATIETLKKNRQLISSLTEQFRGRVVDSPGDNLLAEFGSVVDAIECAVKIQEELKKENDELPESRRMEFRIGVNLGDVVEDGERIYGDGVNIAARIEGLADAGGICISRSAYDQVKKKLNFRYEYLGEHQVKNIDEPVRVYNVLMEPEAKETITELKPPEKSKDKPSIAVLPFVNMSNDPEQEYFSDGMSEELIGALAKLEGLKVISRTSAFYFKGKDVDLRIIGEKLKVDNVLEGSVRKAGKQLRISAQLIKVADDTHLWSETYDRELKDVFAIQDEISQAVVQNLKVKLLGMKTEPLVKDFTKNTGAYELFLKGKYFENKGIFGYEKAIEYMEKAIKADPDYVPAYTYLARILTIAMTFRSLPPWEMKPKISALLQKALEIDNNYAFTYSLLGRHKMDEYDWQGVEKSYKKAIELFPSHSDSIISYSFYLAAIGRIDEAILEAKYAVELDPLSSWHRSTLTIWIVFAGQFDRAIEISQETLELEGDNPFGLSALALGYAGKGQYDKAISIYQGLKNIPYFATNLGYLYGKAGKIEEAQKILDDFLDRSKKGYFSPYMIAQIYSGLSDKDKVFEWLDKAYNVNDPSQFLIKVDNAFDNFHSDPRWTEVLKKRDLAD